MSKTKQPGNLIAAVTGGIPGIGFIIAEKFIQNNIYTIITSICADGGNAAGF
ncbi:MAG: hypothetical protein WDO19_03530 [Bacteroidota bacterium]